ncbi:glycerophosphodiester phosphodiesterase family protein [Vulgatibacter incomptus]|uniref:Glycerophosphoryl diester phosphodiesterase n=1 Tax=Vulgatibacter incomptus TaxID=1391653 RepID=A0A0K1PH75_9BACT|nr:glycerophosphodiester phosphodiesterase family protein [Vulgatibacter incomptus]AKU92474.1 Glycerophosphoryl diester phosphodiesterase [Vulgatibacter incomptus]
MPATSHIRHPLLEPGFRLVAYRGGGGDRPENTLLAFEHAASISEGIVLEVDVQRTCDGVLVAMHDETVDRTTDGRGRVDALTLDELEALDAGFWFQDGQGAYVQRGAGVRVPTLDELLTAHPRALFALDVHTHHREAPRELVKLVEKHQAQGRVVVVSEHTAVVEATRKLRPDWLYSATARQVRARMVLERVRLDWLAPGGPCVVMVPERHAGLQVLSRRLIDVAHERGERVWPWLVETEADAERFMALGVDGFFTPFPSRFNRMTASRQHERTGV